MRDCGGLQSVFPVTKLTPFFAWYLTHHIFYKLAGVDNTKHNIEYNGASHHSEAAKEPEERESAKGSYYHNALRYIHKFNHNALYVLVLVMCSSS